MVEELRRALLAFRETYDVTWPMERHGVRPEFIGMDASR
jgi:hypothetical protein